MKNPDTRIGDRFQQETKYRRPGQIQAASSPLRKPPRTLIPLKKTRPPMKYGLWEALCRRRSVREYRRSSLSFEEFSGLLWATQGLSEGDASPWYRTAPSAGGLHPIDTYLIVHRVEELEPGIYFYRVPEFAVEMKESGDVASKIVRAALEQPLAGDAAVVFVWVAVVERSRQKYRERAYRYIYLDCGHICQNLYLAAAALNLGCCAIGAFFDDEVNALLGLDGREETAVYLATVGKK